MMQTMLTEQDVQDAELAKRMQQLARVEETTPEAMVREIWEYNTKEMLESYTRGAALLNDYIVLMSERSVAGGRFDDDTLERIVSPIIQVESGHIATSQTYRLVGLAQR